MRMRRAPAEVVGWVRGGEAASPLETVPPGQPANATTAIIPGTGIPIKDVEGKEAKRVVDT
jgi:hypothetical protein